MASRNSEEKQGLTRSFKSQMGYGTAPVTAASKKITPRTQKFINRKIGRTDTLQGIALRYGVSVQDLKRENRLYTNDSLFLRETILIPLTPESQDSMGPDDKVVVVDGPTGKLFAPQAKPEGNGVGSNSSTTRALVHNGGDAAPGSPAVLYIHNETLKGCDASSSSSNGASLETDLPKSGVRSSSEPSAGARLYQDGFGSSHNNGGEMGGSYQGASAGSGSTKGSAGPSSISSQSSSIKSASTPPGDFFSKYDKNIAYLKNEVARMENNATDLDGLMEANPLALPYRKGSQSSSSAGRPSFQVSDDDDMLDGDPVLLIRSRTNSRHVKTTLERSQMASDELFEL